MSETGHDDRISVVDPCINCFEIGSLFLISPDLNLHKLLTYTLQNRTPAQHLLLKSSVFRYSVNNVQLRRPTESKKYSSVPFDDRKLRIHVLCLKISDVTFHQHVYLPYSNQPEVKVT